MDRIVNDKMEAEQLTKRDQLPDQSFRMDCLVEQIERHVVAVAVKELPDYVISSIESKQLLFDMMIRKGSDGNYLMAMMKFRALVIEVGKVTFGDLLSLMCCHVPLYDKATLDYTWQLLMLAGCTCDDIKHSSPNMFSLLKEKINYIAQDVRREIKPYHQLLNCAHVETKDPLDEDSGDESIDEDSDEETNPYYRPPQQLIDKRLVEDVHDGNSLLKMSPLNYFFGPSVPVQQQSVVGNSSHQSPFP
jgi:hypothetical protein